MNWREIESAPRDGAMVLLYFSDTGTTIGKWHQPGNSACKGFWACAYHNKRYPTHWAPLPEAPQRPANRRAGIIGESEWTAGFGGSWSGERKLTMYKPQEGTWTLTAPDGRQWTGTSGLRAAAAEQRERIPATVQLERLAEACELTEDEKDATRYRWLRDVGQATVEVFFATNNASGWGCWDSWEDKDAGIDAAMLKTPNVKVTGAAQHGKD